MYKFYNANSKGNFVNDCAIRSISAATGKSWNDTYEELSDEARRKGLMMDSVEFIEEFLDERYDRTCHYSKTVGEFVQEYPEGIFLITMPRTHFSSNQSEQSMTRLIVLQEECGVFGKLNKKLVTKRHQHI